MTDLDLLLGREAAGASNEDSGRAGAPLDSATARSRTRRLSDDAKARIVAESQRPGALISEVSRRHGISEKTLRTWRRRAAGGAGGDRRGAGSAPPYVPVVVDGAASEQTVAIEALGVVVRLPAESAVDRIVAVASGLGRASS